MGSYDPKQYMKMSQKEIKLRQMLEDLGQLGNQYESLKATQAEIPDPLWKSVKEPKAKGAAVVRQQVFDFKPDLVGVKDYRLPRSPGRDNPRMASSAITNPRAKHLWREQLMFEWANAGTLTFRDEKGNVTHRVKVGKHRHQRASQLSPKAQEALLEQFKQLKKASPSGAYMSRGFNAEIVRKLGKTDEAAEVITLYHEFTDDFLDPKMGLVREGATMQEGVLRSDWDEGIGRVQPGTVDATVDKTGVLRPDPSTAGDYKYRPQSVPDPQPAKSMWAREAEAGARAYDANLWERRSEFLKKVKDMSPEDQAKVAARLDQGLFGRALQGKPHPASAAANPTLVGQSLGKAIPTRLKGMKLTRPLRRGLAIDVTRGLGRGVKRAALPILGGAALLGLLHGD
jgi:hypothetical protein